MILVKDIWPSLVEVLGTCEEAIIYERLNDAVELLANHANWDPLVGTVDLCVDNCIVTLPFDIETILALNIGGHPTFGRDKWFEFHINGPGSVCGPECGYVWTDTGDSCLYQELKGPSQFYCASEDSRDNNATIRIYGWDENDKWIMTPNCDNVLEDGFTIPVLYGRPFVGKNTPTVKKVDRIYKDETYGFVKLFAAGEHGTSMVGYYQPYEKLPEYRKIKLNQNCGWVRLKYRRKVFKIRSQYDVILLNNDLAVKTAVQAVKSISDRLFDEANVALTAAVNFLRKEQVSRNPSTVTSMQINFKTMGWNKNQRLN